MKMEFDFQAQPVSVLVKSADGREASVCYDVYHAAVQHTRSDDVFNADVSRMFDERVGQLIIDSAEREAKEAMEAVAAQIDPVEMPTALAKGPTVSPLAN